MLAKVTCKYCSDKGFYPYCYHCKKVMGKVDKKSKKSKRCTYCDSSGLHPFCPKCNRDHNGRELAKTSSNYLTADEERQRFRARFNMNDLTRMYRNIVKVGGDPSWPLEQAYYLIQTSHLTTTGCKLTDQAIIETYGDL